eukprot:TRINITY_DN3900_c0_g1_i1.p1 TRINITY_DN3900_c0_g1~~TRINITY_DN3900_c0_g1_i1.p1  ORF type:complete len:400 (+),score=59.88 TRINITY_DN3900_c0_g1_i1:385-1584(+)
MIVGVPDYPGLRSVYWKLLLSYLPRDRSIWQEVLDKGRKSYNDWVQELIIDPHKEAGNEDHPLSTESSSTWNAFFRDNDLMHDIDKDVQRTLPHLHFFNHDKKAGSTEHYQALKRILFIYAKLNPGIRYVQGMNEILGPIYYVFALDPDKMFKGHAEADAFLCFTNLMAEIRDNFCKTLDNSEVGIHGRILKLNQLLATTDHELWSSLEEKKLNPQFYSFRWLTLLLSQEFELPDVLRVWDSLFADPQRFEFLLNVCCAMLVNVRETLLGGSFADCLKLLQSYPGNDVHGVLQRAIEIQKGDYTPPPPRPKVVDPRKSSQGSGQMTKKEYYSALKDVLPPLSIPSIALAVPSKDKDEEEDEVSPSPSSFGTGFLKPPKPYDADSSDDDCDSGPKMHPLA